MASIILSPSLSISSSTVRPDTAHIALMKKLLANDIIIVVSGCSAQAAAKAGLLDKEAKELCGDGLKRVCELVGIPPVLHMGSCVDISRMMVLAADVAKDSGWNISQIPLVGCAPAAPSRREQNRFRQISIRNSMGRPPLENSMYLYNDYLGLTEEEVNAIVPVSKMKELARERTAANESNTFYKPLYVS